jgi:hypothetical protein
MYKDRARGIDPTGFKRFKEAPFAVFVTQGPVEVVIHSVQGGQVTAEQAEEQVVAGAAVKQSISDQAPAARPPALLVEGDPTVGAMMALSRSQSVLQNMNTLLATYRAEESRQKDKLLGELSQIKQDLDKLGDSLREFAVAAKSTFQARFAELPPLADPQWRVAMRQTPFLEKPEDVSIVQEDGKTVIRTQGQRSSYHLCLDYPLLEGTRLKIRFSVPRNREGAVPWGPQVGIRDPRGQQQQILFALPSTSGPDEIHEVYVDRHGNFYTAMHQERVEGRSLQAEMSSKPPLLFFGMNPPGEVVIHSIHAQPLKSGTD